MIWLCFSENCTHKSITKFPIKIFKVIHCLASLRRFHRDSSKKVILTNLVVLTMGPFHYIVLTSNLVEWFVSGLRSRYVVWAWLYLENSGTFTPRPTFTEYTAKF